MISKEVKYLVDQMVLSAMGKNKAGKESWQLGGKVTILSAVIGEVF